MKAINKVLVTGVGGPAGRSLVTQLLSRGLQVHGIDLSPVPGCPASFETVPPARHPDYPELLIRIADHFAADLIIPTVSEELPVVAGLADRRPLIGSLPAVAVAGDKWLTCRVLSQAGIPVPRSVPAAQLTRDLLEWIGRPVVTKPRVGRGGRGVQVHDRWPSLDSLASDDLVSEFAPGAEYCPNLFIAAQSDADVAVVLRKTGLREGRHGNATGVEVVDEPGIAELALTAARALGLSGPVDIDIRLRTDGTPLVLELNARFGANSAHAPQVLDAVLASRTVVAA